MSQVRHAVGGPGGRDSRGEWSAGGRTVNDWSDLADRLGTTAVADGAPIRWFEELWPTADRGRVCTSWNRSALHWALAE